MIWWILLAVYMCCNCYICGLLREDAVKEKDPLIWIAWGFQFLIGLPVFIWYAIDQKIKKSQLITPPHE